MNKKKTNVVLLNKPLNSMADHALILAYAEGNVAAFECLYARYNKSLLIHLLRQSGNISSAEDLAHDVWLGVIKQATRFRPKASFKTWLYKIAHNRLVDHWRKNGHANHALLDELNQSQNNLEDQSSRILEFEQLLELLMSLSTEQTNAVLLKVEGFSHAEIAEITNTKKETVKSRLRYATQHLRLSMEANS